MPPRTEHVPGPRLERSTPASPARLQAGSPRFERFRPRDFVLLGVLIVAFLGPRLAFLEADPPHELAGEAQRAQALWLEPPAKAHEARNWALFGVWQTNPADEYQFWRRQSPAWVYPLAVVFDLFGVSYATLRGFSIATALLGFLFALALARERYHGRSWVLMGILLAWSFYPVLLDRSGLIEVMVSTCVAGMVLCLHRGDRHPSWLLLSQAFFALAFFAKQGAVFAFPLLVVGNVLSFRSLIRRRAHLRPRLWLPVVSACVIAIASTVYILQPEYQRALGWNYRHMILPGPSPLEQLFLVGERVTSSPFHRTYWFLPFPLVGALAAGAALRALVRATCRQPLARCDVMVLAWFLSAWIALLLIRHDNVRFMAIIVLPTFLLAGTLVSDFWAWCAERSRIHLLAPVVGLLASLAVAFQFRPYVAWVRARTHQLVTAGERIRQEIGEREAVIVGRFSAPLVLETPYLHYYVKWGFNTSTGNLRNLGITHALWRTHGEETKEHLGKLEGSVQGRRLTLLPFRDEWVEVVEFPEPLH